MTVTQKIMREILMRAIEHDDFTAQVPFDEAGIDAVWNEFTELDVHSDYVEEFRCGYDHVTDDIPTAYSRHYESKSVAKKLSDGSWIGWTYWYGGGKHGEPAAMLWMEDAYELDVTETERLVVVREFKKRKAD